MQRTARRLPIVPATSCTLRRLIRSVHPRNVVHPPMSPYDADNIVQQFAAVLAVEPKYGEIARPASILPGSRRTIVSATKLLLGYLYRQRRLDESISSSLTVACMSLGQFCDDQLAASINRASILRERTPELSSFRRGMVDTSIRFELQSFLDSVVELPASDPLWVQRLYTLAGLEYSPEYKDAFDDY